MSEDSLDTSESEVYVDPTVIRPNTPYVEQCPVFSRLRAYQVDRGQIGTLEWTMRTKDERAAPIDLKTLSQQLHDASPSPLPNIFVRVRAREIEGYSPSGTPFYECLGDIYDGENGVVRAPLQEEMANVAGIYEMQWAICNSDQQVYVSNMAYLSVDRGLFGEPASETLGVGPPTIQELRMYLRDSSALDNQLLENVEFDATEIIMALQFPIKDFNECLPPLSYKFNSHNFPFRENWMKAAKGRLFEIAATSYMRNDLQYQAGGVSVADKAKAKPYLEVAKGLLGEWTAWRNRQKVRLNAEEGWGTISSPYSRIVRW